MVNCGPVWRSDIKSSEMTIRETALLHIYTTLLAKGGPGAKAVLERAQEATGYYLQAIDPNLSKLPKTSEGSHESS